MTPQLNRHERRSLAVRIRRRLAGAEESAQAVLLGKDAFPWLAWKHTLAALRMQPRTARARARAKHLAERRP